jgi:type II secretory pathway pseudopilin PulG
MREKLAEEHGNVLVTAIMLMAVMLSVGMAVASTVDTQTAQSRKERERESTFNLAEAALSAQTFILGRRGTGTPTNPYPGTGCASGSTNFFCPSTDTLMRSYTGDASQVDFGADTTWKTDVLDDADATGTPVRFWTDSYLSDANWPRYDKDGNRHVWVRSEANVRGHKRAIVAWVKIEDRIVSFPRYAVLSGYIHGKNSGGHGGRPLVNSTGSLGVAVRCDQAPQSNCIDLNPTKGPQLQPPGNFQLSYPNSTAIGADELAALEDMAKANGTWYDTCPSNPNGDVVFVKNAGTCRYTNSAPAAPGGSGKCCNSSANPGLFILERGTVDFGGNIEFWGVVYHANLDNSNGERLVETSGTSMIMGGVLVDGNGGVYAGSSGDNIVYNAFAFDDIKAVGTAGVVQNTWREIVPASN